MNPKNDKPNFLDRGTLTALILVCIFWFGWSKYMESKYPQPPANAQGNQPAAGADKVQTAATGAAPADAQNPAPPAQANADKGVTAAAAENVVTYESEFWAFQISSKGMGLKNIDIRSYKTRENKPIVVGEVKEHYPFATETLSGVPVDFTIERTAPDTFVGRGTLPDVPGSVVEKTMKIDPATYSIATEIKITNIATAFQGFAVPMSDILIEAQSGSIFNPSYDHQDFFVRHEGTRTRNIIHKADGLDMNVKGATIAALNHHYFSLASVDRSPVMPNFEAKVPKGADVATGRLVYQPVGQVNSFEAKYVAFAGPKLINVLSVVDEHLTELIDLGMFAFLAKPMLLLLRFLNTILNNWGFAIIGLTLIVRLIVMPFNVYSFKSMKAMQKIQPEMNRIREKYKDKPPEQKLQMNAEIMDLMKRSKANPLGGCLPMLLQLPVFIALYAVLGQSIELYRAPFILWIHDLSIKDPFYVLPVLMAVVMYLQQKMTPNTMDPQQAKVMQFMPLIFAFMMISLPSGLTLYIFVSTLFGIIQQWLFMRDRSAVQTVKEAKA